MGTPLTEFPANNYAGRHVRTSGRGVISEQKY